MKTKKAEAKEKVEEKQFCAFLNEKAKKEQFKGFINFFYIYELKKPTIKEIKEIKGNSLVLIGENILKNIEKGKAFLYKLYEEKKKNQNFLIAIKGISYEKDKFYLSLTKNKIALIDIFFPNVYGKESMHFTESGLNHVLLNIMKEKIIALGINLHELIEKIKKNELYYLSKVIQNVSWARKKSVNLCLCQFSNRQELYNARDTFHFLLSFCSTQQALNALTFAKLKIELNKEIFKHKIENMFVYKKKEEIKLLELLKALGKI
ncbi:MAG: hypothetical protein QW622_00105 [Candidatus Pacearchaeota archaeon]